MTSGSLGFLFNFMVNVSSGADPVSYNGYQVWRTKLRYPSDLALIKRMEDNQDISVWNLLPSRTDFLVKSANRLKVHRMMKGQRLNHTVLILNVQRRIDDTKPMEPEWTDNSLRLGHRMDWRTYPSLAIINEYFDNLKDNYPSIVKVYTAGYSVENRTIKMARVSNGNPKNTPILITGGQHAREWVAITSAFYILNNLVTKFDKQPDYIKDKDWYIMPLVNPDGYEYTLNKDRLWRKNRRKMSSCYGVDINRNFPKDWELAGVSEHKECFETFGGSYPFSEPESAAVRDVMDIISAKKTPAGYVDIHSYGQLVLHPWSGQNVKSNHYAALNGVAKKMVQSIYDTTKLKFRYGSAPELLYPASGSAIDWIHSRGVKLVYAIEARDTGTHGFLTPPGDIEIAGKEQLAAVREMAKEIKPLTMRSSDNNHNDWL